MKAKDLSLLMLLVFPHCITWGYIMEQRFIIYSGLALTVMGTAWYLYSKKD